MREFGGAIAERKVLSALRSFLPARGRLIAAVSGGVDSMVLLEGLARLAPGRLLVAHVNHGLRGPESDGDEAFVRERCRALGVEFVSTRLEWVEAKPSQNACRLRRDAFFRSLLQGTDERVWLAHHLNDQAETVFSRLLRGTGGKGLRGMLPESGFKVRPFLALEKSILREAARHWGARWREDSSNRDPEKYERNWLRSIFPLLEERRPGFQSKLAALAEEARGWALPESAAMDLFRVAEGVVFYRGVAAAPVGTLREAFRLSRRHAIELGRLLGKTSGECQVEGARFRWSGGILLEERGAAFEMSLSAGPDRFESSLGVWTAPAGASILAPGKGEARKKEFQSLRVPRFFRDGVPMVERSGKPVALLPARVRDLKFEPSPLGSWWINSSRSN